MSDNNWDFGSNSSSGSFNSGSSSGGSFGSFGSSDGSFGNSGTGFSGGGSFGGSDTFGDNSFGSFGSPSSNMSQPDNAFAENSPWSGNTQSGDEKPGGWCVSMTLASLASACLAFLLAYLCSDAERNVPAFGLFFCAPVSLLMLLVLLIEHVASPMNPRYSRKAQSIIAVVLTTFTFLLGCMGEFFHEYVALSPSQYIIVLDKSGSMEGVSDEKTMDAVEKLMESIPDGQRVGFVSFCHEVLDSIGMSELAINRSRIVTSMRGEVCTGGTDFFIPLEKALGMIGDTNIKTRVLLITDGEASMTPDQLQQLQLTCTQKNASVSCVYIDVSTNRDLQQLVTNTGGNTAYVKDAASVLEGILSTGIVKDADLFHTNPKDGRDMTIAAVILILAAIATGIALTLMLSRRGQKRFQLILSPLLGIAAFVVLNFIKVPADVSWMLEGTAMSLPMLVFMRRNS